jgi:UDP-glucose 4-epimerase
MKKVLVIGDDSYIGRFFEAFANDRYLIKMVSSRDNAWENEDFTGFDSVLYCAGIAHESHNSKMEDLYYRVNCDLTVKVSIKAKNENVGQFIFLSSMSIYGNNDTGITIDTAPEPQNLYGLSKLKGEQELCKLQDDKFKICIVRPPMVYGNGCRGNFPRLVRLAKRSFLFPDFENKRSMIYVGNLCSFFCGLIDGESSGVFLPHNSEYINITGLVKAINPKIRTTRLFNPLLRFLVKRITVFNKLFGDLYYVMSGSESEYNIVSFDEGVKESIGLCK